MLEAKPRLYIITFGTFSGLKYLFFASTITRQRLQTGSPKLAKNKYFKQENVVLCIILVSPATFLTFFTKKLGEMP